MISIYEFISSEIPVKAIDEVYDGIRGIIRNDIKKHIFRLKWSINDRDLSLSTYVVMIKKNRIYNKYIILIRNLKKQLKNEYYKLFGDVTFEGLTQFNLDQEIESIFNGEWVKTPKPATKNN